MGSGSGQSRCWGPPVLDHRSTGRQYAAEMAPVTRGSVVRRDQGQVSADLGDGYVALSFSTGQYISLDTVASFLWERLEEPVAVVDLCEAVATDFDVSQAECEDDVVSFLNQLAAEGLLRIVDNTSS